MRQELPVLPFGPYRRYPIRASEQADPNDERQVCGRCLGGTCCSTEGPIALTGFDVLRLAAFFDLSPADFLLAFTQDRFAGEDGDERYRSWIESAESSIVTYLRRRANHPTSPCIFLKYIHDEDGTPRRVCSVHPARPLACREYYSDTCQKRWTGELAVVHAEGLEMVRDRKITTELVETNCRRLAPVTDADPLAKKWEYAFWSEMRRALDVERANNEGANSYPVADFQDPLDEKLNRLLSSRYLRFEEKYGPRPHGEQLAPYSAGLSFKGSPDHTRLLRIIRTGPTDDLFSRQDYPHFVGIRTMMPGVPLAESFGHARVTAERDEPWARAIARGWDFLLGLGAHAAQIGQLLEQSPWGTFELALLEALLPFDEGIQQRVAGRPCLRPAKRWAGAIASRFLHESRASLAARRAGPTAWMQLCRTAAHYDSGAAPRHLRRVAQVIGAEAARRLPPAWRRDRIQRWFRPLARPRTPEAWRRLVERLSELPSLAALGPPPRSAGVYAAVLAKLERLPLPESPPAWTFEALDAFARASRCSPSPLRRRAADLATRWSVHVEGGNLWDSALLCRWPSLCARLGIAGSDTPGYARSIEHVLSSQRVDGSWGMDVPPNGLPESQDGYVLGALRATSAAVEGLCAALRAAGADGGSRFRRR